MLKMVNKITIVTTNYKLQINDQYEFGTQLYMRLIKLANQKPPTKNSIKIEAGFGIHNQL